MDRLEIMNELEDKNRLQMKKESYVLDIVKENNEEFLILNINLWSSELKINNSQVIYIENE